MRHLSLLSMLLFMAACGGGHASSEDVGPSLDASTAKVVDDGKHVDTTAAAEPVGPAPVLPQDVGGPAPRFLPDLTPPEPTPSAAVRPPGAPVARAPADARDSVVMVTTPAPEVVVMPGGGWLSDLDMRSPLITARSVVWRLFLGIVVLLGVHTLIARMRRRLPKLQDDLLLLQLGSVVTVLLLTVVSVVRTLEQASPVVAGASLLSIGLVVVWIGVRFLPRYIEGLYLVLGPTVRIGDWVALEGDSGILEQVGLTRLTLVREDGRRFSIPVASLGGARFSVQPRDHSAPVDVVVDAGEEPERLRRRLLAAAQVSPYRDPDTPVSATVTGDSLRVHFVAWSPDVVEHAVRHLRRVRARLD